MPVLNGIDAVRQIRKSGGKGRVIFLTVHEDPDMVPACLDAGALGFVVKSRLASDLIPAIQLALTDHTFVSPLCRGEDRPYKLSAGWLNNSSALRRLGVRNDKNLLFMACFGRFQKAAKGLLLLWWIVLQKLCYRFLDVLLLLLWLCLWIEGFTCHAAPNQVLLRDFIHVQH